MELWSILWYRFLDADTDDFGGWDVKIYIFIYKKCSTNY